MDISHWRKTVRRHARARQIDLPTRAIDELAAHLDDVYLAAIEDDATGAQAERRAMAALDTRDLVVLSTPGSLLRSTHMFYSLRLALRQFQHHRAFALITVLVLGLGTGAAAAIYSIVDAVVLRPLPYTAPNDLVALWDTNYEKGLQHERLSPVNFMDARALPVFTDAAAWWRPDVNLADPGLEPVRVKTIETSANLFRVLGVGPQLGSAFPEEKEFFNRQTIATISDRLWRSRYNADPSIIGKQLNINNQRYTVVGIMPKRFHFPDDVDIWLRLQWDLRQHSRGAHFMESVARLAPGNNVATAQASLDTMTTRLSKDFAATNKAWGSRLIPLLDDQLGYYRPALVIVFAASGLLLIIGCLNVAGLLFTRSIDRRREMAVRAALGAPLSRVIGELVAESFVLSAAGGAVGLALAWGITRALATSLPLNIPRLADLGISWHVALFVIGTVTITTLAFGLLPAVVGLVRRGTALGTGGLRDGDRSSTARGRWLQRSIVIGEVALACVLVTASGLLVRSVRGLLDAPSGVSSANVMTVELQPTGQAYSQWPQVAQFYVTLLDDIRQQPGVEFAGATNFLPFEAGWVIPFGIFSQPGGLPGGQPAGPDLRAQHISVTEGYFEALGVKPTSGRFFNAFDTVETPGALIVNAAFAKKFSVAVGTKLNSFAGNIGPLASNLLFRKSEFEIIGVIPDVANQAPGKPVEPAMYYTERQFPNRAMSLTLLGRNGAALTAAVRSSLARLDASLPLGKVAPLTAVFRARSTEARALMTLLVAFGALASLLALVGIYGLLSWSVATRRRELAVRMSLGARPIDVGRLVVFQGLALTATGLVVGIGLLLAGRSLIARVLFETSPTDPMAMLIGATALLVAAAGSCVIPAVRAARTELTEALKVE